MDGSPGFPHRLLDSFALADRVYQALDAVCILPPTFGQGQDILASLMGLEMTKAQELLSADTLAKALALMHEYLQHEVRILELKHDIASKVQTELTKQQRDALLRHQMHAIQEELGEEDEEGAEEGDKTGGR